MSTRQQALDALNAVDGKVTMEGAKESLSVKWADLDLQDKKKKRGRDEGAPVDVFNTQLFFGRASKTTDDAAINTLFSQYGRVKEVLVFKEKGTGQSKGCGFVTMGTRGEADAAMAALNGTFTMEGSKEKFSVQWADLDMQHRKKHVGMGGYGAGMMGGAVGAPGVYGGWQYPAVQPYGYGAYGAYDPYGGMQMYAQQQPVQYGYDQAGATGSGAQTCKLYIGGVPHAYTEKELTPILQPHGNIVNLHILYDKATGTHKGAAFCTFSSSAECDQAIAHLHQKVTLPGNSKPIIAKYAGKDRAAGGFVGAGAWAPSYPAVPAYSVDPYAQQLQQQQPQPQQPIAGYDQYQAQQYAAYGQQQQYPQQTWGYM
uniref:RRM domain-containing protein n=2 Tax=Pyramimonas obovata TaxID=1411642 RepID=A0A7S0RVD4_9CHLO